MAEDTVVELSKNGTDARTVFVKDIQINDLWHIAMGIKNEVYKEWSQAERDSIFDEIIDVWHLAHDLKTHIIDRG